MPLPKRPLWVCARLSDRAATGCSDQPALVHVPGVAPRTADLGARSHGQQTTMPQTSFGCDLSKDRRDVFDRAIGHATQHANSAFGIRALFKVCNPNSVLAFEATSGCDQALRTALAKAERPFVRPNPVHAWHFAQSPQLARDAEPLQSVLGIGPGIGPVTSANLLARLPMLGHLDRRAIARWQASPPRRAKAAKTGARGGKTRKGCSPRHRPKDLHHRQRRPKGPYTRPARHPNLTKNDRCQGG
jgi:hypothetical protein